MTPRPAMTLDGMTLCVLGGLSSTVACSSELSDDDDGSEVGDYRVYLCDPRQAGPGFEGIRTVVELSPGPQEFTVAFCSDVRSCLDVVPGLGYQATCVLSVLAAGQELGRGMEWSSQSTEAPYAFPPYPVTLDVSGCACSDVGGGDTDVLLELEYYVSPCSARSDRERHCDDSSDPSPNYECHGLSQTFYRPPCAEK